MPPHARTNFRGPPSWMWRKCNRLQKLGRSWGAVTLSRWCEGWYIGRWGARRGLKSRSTNYPDHGHHGDHPPTRKIPMVEPGIEPGTSWLEVRSSDYQTTRLVGIQYIVYCIPTFDPSCITQICYVCKRLNSMYRNSFLNRFKILTALHTKIQSVHGNVATPRSHSEIDLYFAGILLPHPRYNRIYK